MFQVLCRILYFSINEDHVYVYDIIVMRILFGIESISKVLTHENATKNF